MIETYRELNRKDAATQRAIKRCRKHHPKVVCLDFEAGQYAVRSSDRKKWHVVTLIETPNGKLLPKCPCEGGSRGLLCFHSAAAAQVWRALKSIREEVAYAG